jgi:Phage gp6-like head-tail connector protein
MALNANALTTLNQAKTFCKIPLSETSVDALMEFYINAASDYIERECDRKLKAQTHTELRHGRKQNILMLKEWPVNSVASLKIDSSAVFTSPDTLVASTEYAIGDDGMSIVLLDRVLPNGYNNVQAIYNAGYSTIPSDLEMATLWLVFWYNQVRNNQDIGRPRKSKGDESFEISQSAPKEVLDAISRYKRTEMPVSDALIRNM